MAKDEFEDLPESEWVWLPKEPRPKVPVEEVEIHPELTRKEAEAKWEKPNLRLDRKCLKYPIPEESTFYRTPDGKAKILFLKGVLDPNYYRKAHDGVQQIKYKPAKNSQRKCLKGSPGGDILFGYNDKLIAGYRKRQQHPEWTAPSVKQFPQFRKLWTLCYDMEALLRQYISGYWKSREIGDRFGPALRGEKERNKFFKAPAGYKEFVEHFDDWLFYSIPGSNFSTITVNHNTIFRAHKDARNANGALSCMACFGTFDGGELCFPRLGVAVNAQKLDLVVCDCPRELHGTLTPVLGNRYSVVAYTKEALTSAGISKKS